MPQDKTLLSPTEIYDRLDALVAAAPSPAEFGLRLMEALGAPRKSIADAGKAATGQGGSFTWTRMLRYQALDSPAEIEAAQAEMQQVMGTGGAPGKGRGKGKGPGKLPRLLLAFDGVTVIGLDTRLGDALTLPLSDLAGEGEFFFPLGGLERYVPEPERLADVQATKRVSRLYDAVRDCNPTWSTPADRHALNLFMARLLFCLFAEDVGLFQRDIFTALIRNHTAVDGSDLQSVLAGAFAWMNTPDAARQGPTRGWSQLRYVRGPFQEAAAMPALDGRCRRFLLECCGLDWRQINPDIFGSMLQAVVDVTLRGQLGMHYTSPTNIHRVLDPLLMDGVRAELERAGTRPAELAALLRRLGRIRIFDPACGSGNFLILAFKALRGIEIEIRKRLGARVDALGIDRDPVVSLAQVFGIEIDDFACRTAQLGLYIAEYQENEQYKLALGSNREPLPLIDAATIHCGNACRVDWLTVCPPDPTQETFIAGNPPYKGSKHQSAAQRQDMAFVFDRKLPKYAELDYVAVWFFKAALFSEVTGANYAFVATNSLVQGQSVSILWPRLLQKLEIHFAYRSYRWTNLAAGKAAVTCIIVGLGPPSTDLKRIFDGDAVRVAPVIGPYLNASSVTIVQPHSVPVSAEFERMIFGNMPNNAEALLLDRSEKDALLSAYPEANQFIRRLYGSHELLQGSERWCLWIRPQQVEAAQQIPELAARFERVRAKRLASSDSGARKMAATPWAFREQNESISHTIMVPRPSSENREYLPIDVKDREAIPSSECFAIFDGAIWQAAVLSSRMHRLWLETVGGRLKEDPRYSNTLVWNTFPLPRLTADRKEALKEHWWDIDLARKESGFGLSLGDLYAPKSMPAALRRAHQDLDRTMETLFGSRPYRSDADRIEHLLTAYDTLVRQDAARSRSPSTPRRARARADG